MLSTITSPVLFHLTIFGHSLVRPTSSPFPRCVVRAPPRSTHQRHPPTRRQVAFWGHPDTSGVRNVDYFVSSEIEVADADRCARGI